MITLWDLKKSDHRQNFFSHYLIEMMIRSSRFKTERSEQKQK